jgi:hypothetical protein
MRSRCPEAGEGARLGFGVAQEKAGIKTMSHRATELAENWEIFRLQGSGLAVMPSQRDAQPVEFRVSAEASPTFRPIS